MVGFFPHNQGQVGGQGCFGFQLLSKEISVHSLKLTGIAPATCEVPQEKTQKGNEIIFQLPTIHFQVLTVVWFRNPAPPQCYKNLVFNNGKNYLPQLVGRISEPSTVC